MRAAGPSVAGINDSVYQALLRNRIIFLGSEVKDENANAICAQMLLLNAEDPHKDIYLYINSPGGSVDSGMAIYDTMKWISNDVATVAMGLAASMGQFLLCAGTKGKRYALPHSRIMMHQPSGGLGGTAQRHPDPGRAVAAHQVDDAGLIAEHTGQTLEQIEADSDRDRWFTAEQALTTASSTTSTSAQLRSPPPVAEPVRTPIMTTPIAAPGGPRASRSRRRWTTTSRSGRSARRTACAAIDPYTKLFEDRIIFLGTPITDDIANAVMAQLLCLQQMDRRARHRDLHQLTRRLVHRADRDLRHDALHQARRAHGLPGPGRLGRRGDPGGRHQGQATRPAEQPDPDPPAGDRGRLRAVLRHRDPGPRDPADPLADGEMLADRHRQDRSKRSAATSSATST